MASDSICLAFMLFTATPETIQNLPNYTAIADQVRGHQPTAGRTIIANLQLVFESTRSLLTTSTKSVKVRRNPLLRTRQSQRAFFKKFFSDNGRWVDSYINSLPLKEAANFHEQMGALKYVEELQKKKQSDVLRFLLRVRCWEVR